ncbi:mismatch repair endonuclease pms2-related [Anaeramoeba ignava]|uniref:Mismatch repair endonuclease pms2-related n=1 Tax=Anaeramoeba ignava TaxID=1746090 RepID=A0A9Q0LSL6_ANAIG|nr:mismatch repair endonuclease pms2-related [Anaeramoeba ignava]
MLKQIDKESIHKITSGQVITTLSSALKELVENSLDAQSNSINIQFINYGIDKFEVSDNGTGISPKDFKTLAKKNCTSKLSTFDDLNKIYSYGFRGEALNSLCSLAEISIITRTEEENVGSILKFDSNGDLIENSPIACSKGTTVICQKIFSKFPVRYNELKRNLKREYSKAITTLQSLALINTQTKISIYLSTNNKFKQLVMSSGGQTLKENIIKIFGTQFAGKLYSLNFITKKEKNSQNQILEIFPFQFSGFISKMEQKYGRRTSDRQLIFVNQRPVDAPKLLQVFNEFYRKKISETSSLSRSTLYPIIIINFVLDPKQFDINVTPDKRKMFVKNERFLIEEIKLYLEKEFDTKNQIQVIDSNFIQNIQQSFIERKNENETISVSIGIQNIQNMFENYSNFLHNLQQKSQKPQLEISDQMEPSKSNSECEAQLQLVLQKEDFLKMEIIGQFNKGFIITKLGNDLFLVDQHAADEKFNYENLLKNSPISTQQLFQPLSLELTTQEELIIEENLDIFHANGFRFSIDKEGKSTQRIKVTSFPISKGKMFTQDDLYEIISHLSQSPGIMYRPNKVSAIFASKACRSSVMIGQSLDFYQMRKIVDHLSSLDHPWKCPHGRPSIRHLCSLSKNN